MVVARVGVSYKATLSDYYWGVRGRSHVPVASLRSRGGIGWESRTCGPAPPDGSVRLAISANYESLQHSVARSPLVEEDHVLGYFAGMAWQF
jgi:hypothetical protein